ncbi:MAG: CPBP family intramembrane metalloprotease [Hymenobacteraceae bacterium]|nr:CPBP family intramembrane metalloprotease [Hymenobacteraceae bacterium]
MDSPSTIQEFDTSASPQPLSLSVGSAWGYIGILFLITLLAGGVIAAASHGFDVKNMGTSPLKLMSYVLPFLLFGLFLKFKGELAAVFRASANQKQVPFLLYLLLIPLVPSIQVVLEPVTSLIPMPEMIKAWFEKELMSKSVYTILTVVVAAPVLEELVFRGLLLRGMLREYSATKAIVWSSVMFAVFHLNPWQGIGAFVVGVFMGWLFYRTRSLWVCIFFHFVNNLLSTIAVHFTPAGVDKFDSFYNQIGNATAYALIYAAALLVLIGSVFYLRRLLDTLPLKEEAAVA